MDFDAIIDAWVAERIRDSAVTRGAGAYAVLMAALNDSDGLKARLRGDSADAASPAGGEGEE
jgi:hypothetical protein